MRLNPDYFDMLKAFNAAGVSYLNVSAKDSYHRS